MSSLKQLRASRTPLLLALAAILATATPLTAGAKPSAFESMAGHYESIRIALVNDTMEGVGMHAASLRDEAKALEASFDAPRAGVPEDKTSDCQAILPGIVTGAELLAATKDLAAAREAFGVVSKPMIRFRSMVSGDRPVVVYCSMVQKPWMQPAGDIGNPYYGQKMLRCGEIVAQD